MWPISTHDERTALSFSNSTSLPLSTLLDGLELLVIPLLTFSGTSSASSRTIISVLRCARPKPLELELELEFEVELELELEFGRLEELELELEGAWSLPKGKVLPKNNQEQVLVFSI